MFDVYLDEAGYTGSDLVNREQPVYALASTTLPDEVARDLVDRCFGGVRARELKHSVLSRRRRGRGQILCFINALAEHPGTATVTVAHKECVLVGLIVDFWVEPALYLDGINLYERGANIGLVNVTYLTLGALLGIEGRREFLWRFQVMVRDRTVFSYESFWRTVNELCRDHPDFESLFGIFEAANMRLGVKHLWKLPEHLADLGDYGLLQTVSHWRDRTAEPLLLVHDKAKALVRNKDHWEALLAGSVPPAIVGQDRRATRFRIDATLQLADSAAHIQLQLADVVAGATATLLSSNTGKAPNEPAYVDALRESSLLERCLIGGVWPSDRVRPEDLETEGPTYGDAAEYMSTVISNLRHRRSEE